MPELKSIMPEPGRPLYLTVKDAVRGAIDQGHFAPGVRLPSTKALSVELSVSLVTVHRAMQELVASGVLRRGQGKGTYVHESYGQTDRPGLGYRFGLAFHAESSLADAYHGQILEGVRQGVDNLGADLVLLRFGEDWRKECHGFLFVNPFEDQVVKIIRTFRSPRDESPRAIMVVGASFSLPGVHCIDSDNDGIGRSAARHFASLGHTRVGFVGGTGRVSNDRDRWNGFRDSCEELGLVLHPDHVFRQDGWKVDEAHGARLEAMLRSESRPTALFAGGYYFALDVYSAAAAVGLRLPDQLSVIGVDDPPSAMHLSPSLTTFRQPLLKLGQMAAGSLLANVLDGDLGVGQRTVLQADLVERGSCAAVPGFSQNA